MIFFFYFLIIPSYLQLCCYASLIININETICALLCLTTFFSFFPIMKMYPQGRMSHHFREMKVGDYLSVKGPKVYLSLFFLQEYLCHIVFCM